MTIKNIPRNTEFKDLLVELVNLYKPSVYMELGVKKGYMFNAIAPLVNKAIGVDVQGFPASVKSLKNTVLVALTTDAFNELWKVTPENDVDLLFIDACHDSHQVFKDFDNFSKYVKEGTGLILLHDTYPINEMLLSDGYCGGAWEIAREIRVNEKYRHNFEICTLPGPYFGLSIVRKAKKHLHWR